MIMKKLREMNGIPCSCGKTHIFKSEIITGSGVTDRLPDIIKKSGASYPYILSDINTFSAAGRRICRLLDGADIKYSSFSFEDKHLEPDERTAGAAFMHMDPRCDMIVAVGSGVINDTAKILALHSKLPFVIVATAPSMDGYASMTSSVTMGGVKTSMTTRCADVIIGDTDILAKAPKKMLAAGVGDMLAKYVSICEWRIAHLICGEYYCEEIAELIRTALKCVTEESKALLRGDTAAVSAVFDGLSAGSIAMNYAGISRPASGTEHYISHIIDMRGAEFGTSTELHGIQCAIGTLVSLKLYEKLKTFVPDRDRAIEYVDGFDTDAWNDHLRSLLGRSAEGMIALEKKEGKYDKEKHRNRLETIIENWNEIQRIISEELPSSEVVEALMTDLGLPTDIADIGVDKALLPEIFLASKDIRDKYVLPRLLFDLGIADEFAESLIH